MPRSIEGDRQTRPRCGGYNPTQIRILPQRTIGRADARIDGWARVATRQTPVKLHLSATPGNVFTRHGPGFVEVGGQRHSENVVVRVDQVVTGWAPAGFAGLTADDFAALLAYQPDIVLLGTGAMIRFPHPRLTQPLMAARIGLEIMDVPAACRTYNVLVAEGRNVLAALLLP